MGGAAGLWRPEGCGLVVIIPAPAFSRAGILGSFFLFGASFFAE